jgi:hypothetical protein
VLITGESGMRKEIAGAARLLGLGGTTLVAKLRRPPATEPSAS